MSLVGLLCRSVRCRRWVGRVSARSISLARSSLMSPQSGIVPVSFRNGYPVITVALPSKGEDCDFMLNPLGDSVDDLINNLQKEDGGIERAILYTKEGTKIAKSTRVDQLFIEDFDLQINDTRYHVSVPKDYKEVFEGTKSLTDARSLIHQLYSSLDVDKYQLVKEQQLKAQLQQAQAELQPLEEKVTQMNQKIRLNNNGFVWLGLGAMCVQFGVLSRLTWCEYSWDIIEPVTYFIGYGTLMGMFAYYIITRQEYVYPDARDRQFLLSLYRQARKQGVDLER